MTHVSVTESAKKCIHLLGRQEHDADSYTSQVHVCSERIYQIIFFMSNSRELTRNSDLKLSQQLCHTFWASHDLALSNETTNEKNLLMTFCSEPHLLSERNVVSR